jgi:large subunit ribosomal protein L18
MANIKNRRLRIKKGIRKKLEGTSDRPRLSVFRSNKVIYAQIIDAIR